MSSSTKIRTTQNPENQNQKKDVLTEVNDFLRIFDAANQRACEREASHEHLPGAQLHGGPRDTFDVMRHRNGARQHKFHKAECILEGELVGFADHPYGGSRCSLLVSSS